MKYFRIIFLISVFGAPIYADDLVEVTATLIQTRQSASPDLSQLELRQQVLIARNGGAESLLKLSSVIESGKWATIKRGRQFWYPEAYSEAVVHQSPNDDSIYSLPQSSPAPGVQSLIFPNSPTKIASAELGAVLRVRPTLKNDGLIYLEGQFQDTVFEGLSQEAIPVKMETKFLIRQSRNHEIMSSRIDRALFRKVEKDFGIMLPYAAGSSENAKRLRQAKSKYTYYIPVVLGNKVFGAHGKIEVKSSGATKGPIRATMMKATMVKDFFIRNKTEDEKRDFGILILDVEKITLPPPTPLPRRKDRQISLESKFVESEKPSASNLSVLTDQEFNSRLGELSKLKGSELLVTPSIINKSGNTGKIEVAQQFIFPTEFSSPRLIPRSGNSIPVKPATPTMFQTQNVGVSLEAKTSIESGNMIRLRVKSSLLAFEGFLDFSNPVMAVKTGRIIKLKTNIADENKVELPVFPFRETETEFLVPNGSHVAMTMIFDHQNMNHKKDRLLKFRKPMIEEVKTPRYLTIYLSPKIVDSDGNPQ